MNGRRLGRHNSGYTSFRYPLPSDLLRWNDGDENVLAIHVVCVAFFCFKLIHPSINQPSNQSARPEPTPPPTNKQQDASVPDGWWYDGGGIYRSIRLVAANALHITPWGAYLPSIVKEGSIREARPTPEEEGDEGEKEEARHDLVADATLMSQVTVTNDGPSPATVALRIVVTGPALGAGQAEATARTPAPLTLGPGATETVALPVDLPGVALWSIHRPQLFQVSVQLWAQQQQEGQDGQGETLVDEVKEMTGVRTLRFDADRGFFLNGVPTKIQGMCNHQDFAGTGVAVPPSLQAYRVRRMKEMGANAWRTAHNPPAPELLEEADRQGLMVWVRGSGSIVSRVLGV
jgi:beta-galactosidase